MPKLDGRLADELKAQLFPGSSVANPIDILATGTPEHLGIAIDYCEKKFDNIDAMMVIFGTPGSSNSMRLMTFCTRRFWNARNPSSPSCPV